ncbi:hypothetical protein TWF696_004746 [Orbilia brochopaga]|uniref:Uncharacterized protein n=1 Tax=Orbilia brochopaga TaxID=3140254 RepID=A0AAV9UYX9_9PEZI
MPRRKAALSARRASSSESGDAPPDRNLENVKIMPFNPAKCPGRDPAILVGKHIIQAKTWTDNVLILTLQERNRQIWISNVDGSLPFIIQTCPLLGEHLWKVNHDNPLKIIAAVRGKKSVAYAAPFNLRHRELHGKLRIDKFDLVGLQLEGMEEMGWIWAEDMQDSFEAGALKASVYMDELPAPTAQNHTSENEEDGQVKQEEIKEEEIQLKEEQEGEIKEEEEEQKRRVELELNEDGLVIKDESYGEDLEFEAWLNHYGADYEGNEANDGGQIQEYSEVKKEEDEGNGNANIFQAIMHDHNDMDLSTDSESELTVSGSTNNYSPVLSDSSDDRRRRLLEEDDDNFDLNNIDPPEDMDLT